MADSNGLTGVADKNKVSVDLRIVTLVLLAVIAGMLFAWKPWVASGGDDRVVTVSGEAVVTDRPDEYVFYPSYQFKNADRTAALAELTQKSEEVVSKLKSLGVPDRGIKTNASGYDYQVYYDSVSRDTTYTLQITVTVGEAKLAQTVQDYLVTTNPTGSVSPQAGFSTAKQKQLEDKARNEATTDARKKADQMAQNLGFKVGRVKSVSDSGGFGIMPMYANDTVSMETKSSGSLTVQPGENDLSYSVTVVYFVR